MHVSGTNYCGYRCGWAADTVRALLSFETARLSFCRLFVDSDSGYGEEALLAMAPGAAALRTFIFTGNVDYVNDPETVAAADPRLQTVDVVIQHSSEDYQNGAMGNTAPRKHVLMDDVEAVADCPYMRDLEGALPKDNPIWIPSVANLARRLRISRSWRGLQKQNGRAIRVFVEGVNYLS